MQKITCEKSECHKKTRSNHFSAITIKQKNTPFLFTPLEAIVMVIAVCDLFFRKYSHVVRKDKVE
jgi:hypothetical protein